MSDARRPLAIGQLREPGLLKLIPPKSVLLILTEYVKKKTGRPPDQPQSFEGILLRCEGGKIFFKDGNLEFEPHPFYVKKVKDWGNEIRRILRTYAGGLYVKRVCELLEHKYTVLRRQSSSGGIEILEVKPKDQETDTVVLQVAVLPSGKVSVFSDRENDRAYERANELISYLEDSGVVDF
ncbi:hypothetical protein [Thermodesulforhabdus norvegica]|uniref:Uncharacterized protein n=1 Tax=Thermodesulforhabdus norvegica TaxID=39841 RepID=A0A1I4VCG6_9BACT|nr:hypothetical protein [Thermodesulforhabdus norvegica]SFM98865.1 hypothetical protein SAMN05660836_02205 [Thermodesulforhabdus norvegica]